MAWSNRALTQSLKAMEKLPPAEVLLERAKRYTLPAVAVAGLLTADLAGTALSVFVLKPPARSRPAPPKVIIEEHPLGPLASYESIVRKNAFCPGCPVPDIRALADMRPKDCSRAKSARASLKIIGTIVLSDPAFSVATVQDGGSETLAIKRGDAVRGLGKVFEIRRNRICFESQDGVLSFVEIPEEPIRFGSPIASANLPKSQFEGITRNSENEVEIRKSFLMEKITDPGILTQAYAVPFPDANGNIQGFKILTIQPGSAYEALGIKAEDVIVAANGEPMNSLARAQELWAQAATVNELTLDIIRNGQTIKQTFKIK